MSASIEQALQTLISGLSAVNGLGTVQIRPYKMAQKDLGDSDFGGVIISVRDQEDQQVDLSGRGGGVASKIGITCIASTFLAAWTLSEAVRTNGTNPGTGLAGYAGTPAGGVQILMA